MAVPAVVISTFLGAINGYVIAQWRFRGANLIFSLMLFGCFIPFQVVLLPMARLLGIFGLAGSIHGLVFVHVIYGLGFTTLFFRNYYVSISPELIRAAKIDGAGFFRIFWSVFLPLSIPNIVVTVIWQFTQIWNDFLFGVSFSQAGTQPVTVALNNIVNSTTGVKEYNVDMAAAIIAASNATGLCGCGKIFYPRPDCWFSERISDGANTGSLQLEEEVWRTGYSEGCKCRD